VNSLMPYHDVLGALRTHCALLALIHA
jgi:hypothetical protein